MSFPQLRDCKPHVDDKELDEVEALLGIILPHDLRSHFLKYNGGKPKPEYFQVDDDFYMVRGFFSVKYGIAGDPDLTFEKSYQRLSNHIPEGLIPFADDAAGNLFCYSVNKESMHNIFFWEHEFYDDDDQGLRKLAPNLHVFLNGFAQDPDVEDEDDDDED